MYGKTVYEVWIEKYGEEEAERRDIERKKKLSKSFSGKNNPMYGKPSPHGAGNGWSGWYKGWFFRSLRELNYMVNVIEANNHSWITAEKKKWRVPYTDWEGTEHTYAADFLVDNILLIEIKPKRLHNTPLVQAKAKAGKKLAEQMGWTYQLVDPGIPPSDQIKELHDTEQIKFTKRYEQRYQDRYCN